MAERLLLLPSLSVCLLAGAGVDALARTATARRAAAVGVAAAVVVLFGLFRVRAAVWENEDVYFPAAAAASPLSAKAQYEYGNWLLRKDRPLEAEAAYAQALAIVPAFSRAASYRAESMARRGDPAGAVEVYLAYLALRPDDTGALTNVTRLLLKAGRPEEAVKWAQKLVAQLPGDQKALDALLVAEIAQRRANAAPPGTRTNEATAPSATDAPARPLPPPVNP
jgi:tetratricopeptide (TPR) repeat protein